MAGVISRTRTGLALVLLLQTAAACGDASDPCGAGEARLSDGGCHTLCAEDGSCPTGLQCERGVCFAAVGAARSALQTTGGPPSFVVRGTVGGVGDPGQCSAGVCDTMVIPSVARVSVLQVRAVNPTGGATLPSWRLNGMQELSAPTGAGFFLGVLDLVTHMPSGDVAHNRPYEAATELDALGTALLGIGSTQMVVLVSHGDVAAALTTDLGGVTLAEILETLGAHWRVESIAANEAFVFAGAPGLAPGTSPLVVSGAGVAEATWLLLDTRLALPRTSTSGSFGPSIESPEIEDGTLSAVDFATGAVTSVSIGNGVISSADLAAGFLVDGSKVAGASLSGADFGLPSTVGALTVTDAGRVGVGTTAPGQTLEVNGGLRFGSGTGVTLYSRSGTNPTCDAGGDPWMTNWVERTCTGTGNTSFPLCSLFNTPLSCTVSGGWAPTRPVCSYCWRNFFVVSTPSGCVPIDWTDVVCIKN